MVSQRVISALLAAPLVVLAAYYGGFAFLAVLLLISAFAWLELQQLVHQPLALYRTLGLLLLCLVVFLTWVNAAYALPALAGSLLVLLTVQLTDFDEHKWTAATLAISSFFYLALPLVHLVLLRTETGDWRFVLLLLLITWGYDTFAFFCGLRFGRVRPWAKISPKKSVEGLIGGLIGSVALSLLLLRLIRPELPSASWVLYATLLGVGAGCLAHIGDLTESAIKRTYQVKDSGHFLPGHGGLLDRIDSVLFAAVYVFYFVKYLVL